MCHLEEMFGFVDLILQTNPNKSTNDVYETIVSLSIFFHDAIYNPKSSTNEEDSLSLYKSFEKEIFQELTLTPQDKQTNDVNKTIAAFPQWIFSEKISLYILTTKSHSLDGINMNEIDNETMEYLKIFIDADMAVLGKQSEAYDYYASLIRKEYIHVPHDMYCEKRAEILQSFVKDIKIERNEFCEDDRSDTEESKGEKKKKRFIYATKVMRDSLEERAVSNLEREIALLKRGIIPGSSSTINR